MFDSAAKLLGTWGLVSFVLEFQNSNEKRYPLGKNPNGYLVLTQDGQLMTLMTARERKPGQTQLERAELFKTMLSYTGHYRIEDDQVITKVDASWNEAWNGTLQDRTFAFDGETLVLKSLWAPHPGLAGAPIVRSVLHWQRIADR